MTSRTGHGATSNVEASKACKTKSGPWTRAYNNNDRLLILYNIAFLYLLPLIEPLFQITWLYFRKKQNRMEAAAPSRRKSHRAFVAILLSVVFSVSYNFSKFRSWKPLEEENGLHESLVTENNKPKVAGLSCPAFPLLEPSRFEAAQRELVYWRDIPDDSQRMSPYACSGHNNQTRKFLTFEPDEGGWNNARMAAETAITMAIAMGRVLVLPPTTTMYLLWETSQYSKKTHFGFMDFFPLELLQEELAGLEIMTFQEFLEQEVLKGHVLADPHTGEPLQPPGGKTKWDGSLNNWESGRQGNGQALWQWWRSVATPLPWKYYECTAVFPTPSQQCDDQTPWNAVTEADEQRMRDYMKQILQQEPDGSPQPRIRSYDGNPTAVDASPLDRLSEMVADRRQLCIYDRTLQDAPVLHAMGQQSESTTRFLVHFYAFVFLEDWRHDIWLKRLVRDHLRFVSSKHLCVLSILDCNLVQKCIAFSPCLQIRRRNTVRRQSYCSGFA